LKEWPKTSTQENEEKSKINNIELHWEAKKKKKGPTISE
jgi:hypothetical protein